MKKNTSFTLIELLVVIVIIGVLAGVIIVTTTSSISNATLARAKAFSSNIQNSMLLNLVSEWTFDEPEEVGRTTKDSWGVNDGAVIGAIRSDGSNGECVFGGCYNFNGTENNYIECGVGGTITTKQMTISAFFNLDDLNEYRNIIFRANGESLYPRIFVSPVEKQVRFQYRIDGNTKLATSQLNSVVSNKWYFVVGVIDVAKGGLLYVNGEKTGQNLDTGSLISGGGSKILIGKDSDSGLYMKGLIDDVRIYNAALSSSQIKQNYIAGLNSLLSKGQISKEEYNQRLSELAQK